jgi:protein-tyrosine-phosphatase
VPAAVVRILFVCTGNMCRSALAEGIARARMGPERGVAFESAGFYALDDAPASPHAVEAAAEVGVNLRAHRARTLSRELAHEVDLIYVMTSSQVDSRRLADLRGEGKVHLLDPGGEDVADPYGGDLSTYRQARDHISVAVQARLEEWAALAEQG